MMKLLDKFMYLLIFIYTKNIKLILKKKEVTGVTDVNEII